MDGQIQMSKQSRQRALSKHIPGVLNGRVVGHNAATTLWGRREGVTHLLPNGVSDRVSDLLSLKLFYYANISLHYSLSSPKNFKECCRLFCFMYVCFVCVSMCARCLPSTC